MAAGAKPGSKLQSRTPEEYGEKYHDHLLEQYKLFVETSQQVSDRRQNANNYLLTLNSSLVMLFVAFLSTFGHHRYNVLIPITGCIVCFIWYSLVDSYKDLNNTSLKISFRSRCFDTSGGFVGTERRGTSPSRINMSR